MTERANHPDFDAAAGEHKWAGTLPELAERLRKAAWDAKGEWAWFVLPRGALVAMRVPPSFVKELRIARRLRKAFTDASAKAWHTEVQTFLDQLGLAGWKCTKDVLVGDPTQQLTVEVIYQEAAPLGAPSALLTCARCGKEFEPHPDDKLYREPTCTACAIALGADEARANKERQA